MSAARCDQTDRLYEYALDALAPADAAAMEVHLATCAACREQLASLRTKRAKFISLKLRFSSTRRTLNNRHKTLAK